VTVRVVHWTLVSVACPRYLRLIDLTTRIWFHVFEENSVKPLERLTHGVTFRSGIIGFRAITRRSVFENDKTSLR
jgi:hypothetical protein